MFDPTDDLAAVSDGLETVTLLRRGSSPGTAGTVIAHALRRAMTAAEATIVNRGDVLFSEVQSDSWASDWNFKHIPDISEHPAFPESGKTYIVEYRIVLNEGQPLVTAPRVKTM